MMQLIKNTIKSIFQAAGFEIRRHKNQPYVPLDYLLEEVTLDQVDPVFEPNQFGTKLDTQVHFVGRSSLYATGATSDSESWILSVLAKKAKNMFEFGTCTGRTTYHLAVNSSQQAVVTTLTMPPLKKSDYKGQSGDDPDDKKRALLESNYEEFFYTGTAVETKICQIFCDSKQFDETDYVDKCDLIFIDGSHAYSYVKSDTQKALRMLTSGGIILWHDYGNNVKGVAQYLHELYKTVPLKRIHGTVLAFYVKD